MIERPAFPSRSSKKARVVGSASLINTDADAAEGNAAIAKVSNQHFSHVSSYITPVKCGMLCAMTKPITHRPLMKAGRKPTTPPAEAFERIRELAAEGRAIIGIARRMGVSKDAFNGWLEREPALREAIEIGREDKRYALYLKLKEAADKGNVTAALAILNSEHGWRNDQTDSGNRVNVTIALPGAMTLQQFTSITGKGDRQ